MKSGDRVKIVSYSHPWHGWTGLIVGPPDPPIKGLDWTVAIDNTPQHSAASERDLRLLSGETAEELA